MGVKSKKEGWRIGWRRFSIWWVREGWRFRSWSEWLVSMLWVIRGCSSRCSNSRIISEGLKPSCPLSINSSQQCQPSSAHRSSSTPKPPSNSLLPSKSSDRNSTKPATSSQNSTSRRGKPRGSKTSCSLSTITTTRFSSCLRRTRECWRNWSIRSSRWSMGINLRWISIIIRWKSYYRIIGWRGNKSMPSRCNTGPFRMSSLRSNQFILKYRRTTKSSNYKPNTSRKHKPLSKTTTLSSRRIWKPESKRSVRRLTLWRNSSTRSKRLIVRRWRRSYRI